jgi:hypothetical protein
MDDYDFEDENIKPVIYEVNEEKAKFVALCMDISDKIDKENIDLIELFENNDDNK